MLGKTLPYLSSLVTITTPTRSTRSSRFISLIIPIANTSFGRLSCQFSAASDWNELQTSLKLETFIFLTYFKHQLSEQLTNRCSCIQLTQSIYLIPILFLFYLLFCSFAHQYLYLHIIIRSFITPVLICLIVIIRSYGLFIALPPHAI